MWKVKLCVLSHIEAIQGQADGQGALAVRRARRLECQDAEAPRLRRLTDMFTPDRKCRVYGLPKQRRSKTRGASLVIYLSAANPQRAPTEAEHVSVRRNPT